MTLNEFIVDALEKENGFLMEALDGLGPGELAWQPGADANSIGWILWHMVRVEDMWIQFFAQFQTELWETEGWHEKFGLPTRDNGFGHTSEQVNNFPGVDLDEFLRYRASVRQATLAYLDTLTPDDMERVPRERRPEMSLGAMFRQIIGEMYQHVGHIAYLRGLQGR
ncbi:MAG: DinB family protein [Chloroflexota bacterium]|nr:DinB family protein [Chloroflexota bacterium]MDE2960808.1 DinB family protein [Chloroflexota bacterium]